MGAKSGCATAKRPLRVMTKSSVKKTEGPTAFLEEKKKVCRGWWLSVFSLKVSEGKEGAMSQKVSGWGRLNLLWGGKKKKGGGVAFSHKPPLGRKDVRLFMGEFLDSLGGG